MAETAKKDTPEIRYLLGSLSEDEATRLEEIYFADDAKFEELELAEDELIDAYVRQELTDEERQQFIRKLRNSPRLVERLHFAQVLAERAFNPFPPEPEATSQETFSGNEPPAITKVWGWKRLFGPQLAFQGAFAACLVLLLVGGPALVTGWFRLRSESERINAERAALQRQKEELDQQSIDQRARTEQLTADLQRERDQRARDEKLIEELKRSQRGDEPSQQTLVGTVASLFLTTDSLRSGGSGPQLTVRDDTTTAELRLALERNDYRSYSVSVRSGVEVFSKTGLKPHKTSAGQILVLSVPSARLPPDDYTVSVHGHTSSGQIESVSDYAFRVTKK